MLKQFGAVVAINGLVLYNRQLAQELWIIDQLAYSSSQLIYVIPCAGKLLLLFTKIDLDYFKFEGKEINLKNRVTLCL